MSTALSLRRARAHAIVRHRRRVMDQIADFESRARQAALVVALGARQDETPATVEVKH